MNGIKVLIVEDEVLISEELKGLLEEDGYEVVGIAEDFETALAIIEDINPDIALLDINLQNKDEGFRVASYLNNSLSVPYLFLSSYSDSKTLDKAVKLGPSSYITKPYTKEQVLSAVKVLSTKIKPKEFILIKSEHQIQKVYVGDILWIKADDVYIEIRLKRSKIVLRTSIKRFLEEFSINNIVRVHRSYAVNLKHVDSVTAISVNVSGKKLPLSRLNKKPVQEAFLMLKNNYH